MDRRAIKLDMKGILCDVVNDSIMGFTSRTLGVHKSTGNSLATWVTCRVSRIIMMRAADYCNSIWNYTHDYLETHANLLLSETNTPVPVAARSKAYVWGRSPAAILGSNPTGGHGCLSVLSGRGLCDELITRPEEYYRVWCVVVCDLETSWKWRPW